LPPSPVSPTGSIVRAVTVLVVLCPCALVLATPTAVTAAIDQATKYGAMIKSGDALERMGNVDFIAFDKTGTLTHGDLVVSDIVSFDSGISETELLKMTASFVGQREKSIIRFNDAPHTALVILILR
jgi:P-type E1-E2 ATPase